MPETKKQKAMRQTLGKIATMPLSKQFDLDERGEIKSGSNAYGPQWAAWHFQELAKRAIQ
jgi:hypothetical protein